MSSPLHPAFRRSLLLAFLSALWLTSTARADYTVALHSDGSAIRTVRAGEEFNLDVQTTAGAADQISSADFRVEFSTPGLGLVGYDWSAPFVTAGMDDASVPATAALPAIITAGLVADGPGLTNRVDIYLSNFTTNIAGYHDGRLLRLRLMVPTNYNGVDTIRAQVIPESFGDGFTVIPAKAAQPFSLKITPSTGQAQSSLSITLQGGVLSLSWPITIEGVKLQTAPDLTSTWSDVSEAPQLANGRNVVQLPFATSSPKKFFRLKLL
jgi:hypothetical protein